MGKSKTEAPKAPDPVATAAAQTQQNVTAANAQATLNHSNQITPYGSQTWAAGPADANGVSQWTSTTTLSPAQQALADSGDRISQNLANLGEKQLGNVSNTMAQPFNYNNAPAQVTNVQSGNLINSVSNPALQHSVAGGKPLQTSANYGKIQDDVDMSKVPGLVGGADLQKTYQDAQGAAYKQQAAYLDTNYGQQQHDLENKLIQQGLVQGSDAWNNALNNLGQQRTFDYNNAFNNSFSTGLQAQNQIYNQGLASNQNAYSQASNNGAFHNNAQQQGFGQAMANAQLNNAASGQTFAQNMSNAQLGNTAAGQEFNQGVTNATLNNSNQNQLFNQGVANANLQNQGRTQSINETNYLRQQPLNELNALRTGSQVTAPQFGSTPQGTIAPADIASLYNQKYQGEMSKYNSDVASNNSMTSGLMSLAGTAAMFMSDPRTKENVQRVGTRADGLGIYHYDYKPEFKAAWGSGRFEGVMADEVESLYPHAVAMSRDGYKMVNYGALHA